MNIEANIPLASYTTFGIGGPARWFVQAGTEEEIVEAAGWARSRGVPLFVLGGGSNLLVADAGFDGLVLRVGLKGIESHEDAPGSRIFRVAAGEEWEHCVQRTLEDDCAGLECLSGIPGTVGGTPVQNVGAYGQEVATVIDRVRVFDLEASTFMELPGAACGFGYRCSRFNSVDRGRYIVTRVDYRLTPGGAPSLQYADLQRAFADTLKAGVQPSLAEVAAAVREIRRSKGMLLVAGDPDCRSAGSFFKNPVVTTGRSAQIAAASPYPPPSFPAGEDDQGIQLVKLSAAWLIEHAGFGKGYSLGAAGVSARHTLALINRGGATAADIVALATRIRGGVQARFGVELEMEPRMVGF